MARRKKTWEDYLKAKARQVWGWSSMRSEARAKAERGRGNYMCAHCAGIFDRGQTQVDHIETVDNPNGWDGWGPFIDRLFCSADKLAVLCIQCHQVKSENENKIRRQRKGAFKNGNSKTKA